MLAVFFLLLTFLLLPSSNEIRVFTTGAEMLGHLGSSKHCRGLTITDKREKADYRISWRFTGAGPGRRPWKITVFNKEGELIYSGSTRRAASAAKDACRAIHAHQEELKK